MARIHEDAAAKADEIEAEMRRLGWWDMPEPPPAAFESRQPFFGDTMAFVQWLRFVLVPRVRQIVAEEGNFPEASYVGIRAVREFDGQDAGELTTLLNEFDALFGSIDPLVEQARARRFARPRRSWFGRLFRGPDEG